MFTSVKKALPWSAFFIVWLLLLPVSGRATLAHSADPCPDLPISGRGQLQQVIDGDTVELKDGRKVRLLGINTAEIDHQHGQSEPFATQARHRLKLLIPRGTQVRLQTDLEKFDRYGRVLAHLILTDGSNPAVTLLREGLATILIIPPNTAAVACFTAIERNARSRSIGIWSHPRYKPTSAASLTLAANYSGYRVISGRITQFSSSSRFHYLILDDRVSARISKQDWNTYFVKPFATHWPGAIGPQQLLTNTPIVIRGWLHSARPNSNQKHYSKLPQMRLYHPAGLEWAP